MRSLATLIEGMNRLFGGLLALLLGACTVPSFRVGADDAGLASASCDDGQINGTETDTDCGGGSCDPCPLTAQCTRASDCQSSLCDEGQCAPLPSCADDLLNGTESDTDCGGDTCEKCALGAQCARARDCESALCKAGVCATPSPDPTCADGARNGTETDADCGGDSCDPCAVDQRCTLGTDCLSLVCDGVCQPSRCDDGVRNGDESDQDCGGACAGCDPGSSCKSHADCASLDCKGGHCLADSCTDSIENGSETAPDCGGTCPACATGEACAKAADCQSAVCAAKTCAAATCSDGVQNGGESDKDCGAGCTPCASGQSCTAAADCASATCTQTYCVPKAPSGGVLAQSGWIASASDSDSAFAPSLGSDGNLSTRWDSGKAQSSGMWYEVDLGKPQIFFSVTLDDTNRSGDAAQLFDVYLSLTPTFPATPTVQGVSALPRNTVTFPGNRAVVARYVKLVLSKNYAQSHWSIQELTLGN